MERDTISHLTALGKLTLTPEEEERAAQEMERLLAHFRLLREAPTAGVEPSPQPGSDATPLRADVPGPALGAEEVLANAPDTRSGCFRVPRTVTG